ncbi:MAG: hypothetical protein LBU27_02460 [Candidatus Peribacteria bacterium]|nr:hypothetical protein [Candidatus Peribacteria bacterium]
MIKEGLVFHKEKGEFHSLSSAGVGAGLMAVDGFFAYRAIKHGRFLKYMVSPVVDSISFLKSMASGTYTAFKMTKDGVKLLRAGEYASVGAEAMKFLKGSGARLAGIALLAYLGYRGISALFDTSSAEEQQQLAELEKLPPQELQEKIKQEWPKLSEEEKETLIKLATAVRMKETTNLENIEVKKEGNVVKIRFKYLVNYTTMKQEEQDLQQALSELEVTKDLKIVYTLDVGEVKYALKAYKKHNDLTDQQLQEYIATI